MLQPSPSCTVVVCYSQADSVLLFVTAKPIVYTGIVKYVGRLDKEQYDARIYCGVRLDEPSE